MGPWGIVLLAVVALVVAVVIWGRWRRAKSQAERDAAQAQFVQQRGELAGIFLRAANETGKPRGLSWEKCELGDDALFAVDRATGELFALVDATISFAAIPGGGMEDVEAVGNLRYATAVFVHRKGSWQSDGQAVFNLEPAAALERYSQSLAATPEDTRTTSGQ